MAFLRDESHSRRGSIRTDITPDQAHWTRPGRVAASYHKLAQHTTPPVIQYTTQLSMSHVFKFTLQPKFEFPNQFLMLRLERGKNIHCVKRVFG